MFVATVRESLYTVEKLDNDVSASSKRLKKHSIAFF